MGTADRYFVFIPFSEVGTIKKTERCLCEQGKNKQTNEQKRERNNFWNLTSQNDENEKH